MFDFIRAHQQDLMLILCGACGILIFLLLMTRALSKQRRGILILLELMAFLLLWFDRLAYVYAGVSGTTGYMMVRISNFAVFFLTPGLALGFTLYVSDRLMNEGRSGKLPVRLKTAAALAATGMILAVISAFTDLYYYFDEANLYHRGQGFLISYIIPVICPIMVYTVIRQYRKEFGELIYTSLVLYVFIPIICGIIQIFTYGISLVNLSMAAVSISIYIFMYLDLNDTVEHAHKTEIQSIKREHDRMRRLFDQTARAFVFAVEKKDVLSKGNSVRIAEYAGKVARHAGKSPEECEKVYYAALLHDVGLAGIPDDVIDGKILSDSDDQDVMRQKALIGKEILSGITEYPYLEQGSLYRCEKYNGTGYPEGLKGEEIPEISRIIAVAEAYVLMTARKRYRDELPRFVAREAFVRGSGDDFDPVFADIMVKIIDEESNEGVSETAEKFETRICCDRYREHISRGIPVETAVRKIRFKCAVREGANRQFCAPSIVLFDSYDGRAHDDIKSIESYHYLEYCEIWFDAHSVKTAARKILEKRTDGMQVKEKTSGRDTYEIIAGRYEDHLKLVMKASDCENEIIIALPSRSRAVYIGLTGENCNITDICVEETGQEVGPADIPRIIQPVSYIDHLESDIKNVQIDRWMSASTEGVEVTGKYRLCFHTMSLPESDLIWHCPYIILFYSDDRKVGGPGYREYNLIKLNGEDQGDKEFARNRFSVKKTSEFPGWEKWKEMNKEGIECEVSLEKKGNRVILKTENLGINIENITTVTDDKSKVYVALSGDQVALTDIRID